MSYRNNAVYLTKAGFYSRSGLPDDFCRIAAATSPMYTMRLIVLTSYTGNKNIRTKNMECTVADTCQILFFSGISKAFETQGGANISNAF